jgi:predicted SprT family Zn-dependent metalloprotease
METEYKCSCCTKQLTSKEVNTNDDFGIIVSEFVCCNCETKS